MCTHTQCCEAIRTQTNAYLVDWYDHETTTSIALGHDSDELIGQIKKGNNRKTQTTNGYQTNLPNGSNAFGKYMQTKDTDLWIHSTKVVVMGVLGNVDVLVTLIFAGDISVNMPKLARADAFKERL